MPETTTNPDANYEKEMKELKEAHEANLKASGLVPEKKKKE